MSLKKKDWIPYGRKAESVEINVKDNQNQTIDFFKLYKGKTRDAKRIMEKIKERYDFDFNPQAEVKEEKEEEKIWLKKDMKW